MQSANDWASPDPNQNITLAEANTLRDALVAGLQVQFADRYIRTTQNRVIKEAELRANPYIMPLPVNLFGHLAAPDGQEFNIAEFRASLRDAAVSNDPTGTLCGLLSEAMPKTNVADLFTRIPAIQQVITSALKTL